MTLLQIAESIKSDWSKALWDCNKNYENAEGIIIAIKNSMTNVKNPKSAIFEIDNYGHISINGKEFAYCVDAFACPPDYERYLKEK